MRDKLQIERISVIVTKKCTLKCKLCGALAPYIESYHPSIDFLESQIDSLFEIVDKVGIIDISGGEPFIRGTLEDFALGEFLLYLVERYSSKFNYLRIFTNATIIPSDELCSIFNIISSKVPFNITIDDYGIHSPKVKHISQKLTALNIDYLVRDYSNNIHCGGWVDLRNIQINNEEAVAKKMYLNCAIPHKLGCCLELLDGIISPCSVAASRYICGEADKNDQDIVDLFADKETSIDKLYSILNSDCFISCFSCDGGMSEDSQRFIPAEQATIKDIKEFKNKYKMRF